ncbi:MAG TPA: hypothetical protein VF730_04420 [Terracidiphilus sp.]
MARPTAITLLAFLGITALAGAVPLILHPAGSVLMPLSLLQHSPFHSFLIPGVILLVANGLLSLAVLGLVVAQSPNHALWVMFQGSVLLGWLVIECWMLRTVIWLHWFYAVVALALIVVGLTLRRSMGRKSEMP